jgi:hypothetical protein
MPEKGEARRNSGGGLVTVLTCKSLVKFGYMSERLV